jgi:RND family efflux transporter MFP subunit
MRSAAVTRVEAAPAIAVSASKVRQLDIVQQLSGVGNVQSLNSVLLRPQIDGVLTKILVREGERVQRNQLIALIDDRALGAAVAQARAEKSRNEASLKIAELNLKRDSNLLAQQAISSQTVDEQRALVEQLEATVQSNEAAVHAAEIQQSYARITSPVAGKVGMRRVDPGNLVHASDTGGLFSVAQVDPISIVFTLPQQDLPRLQPLLDGVNRAEVIAFDRDAGTPLATGYLSTADNQIDASTGTIQLRAAFANGKGLLWPGQFVTVQLRIGTDRNVTAVAARALQHSLDGTFVFRVKGAAVEVVPVKVRYEEGGTAAIDAGLQVGDLVVTEGQDQLKAGTAVKVVAGDSVDVPADAVAKGASPP